ncbi:OadG family protein [Marinomonas mediterranea]|jgi:sodium pump decarboxylases, gamma subunit|uniref:Probable oxaloacetate decarboxylase gamma chain n=1 Tax=Marinomonas mediterranea (strain ATCC 700492 / JCM 21426 / NBRC 103028 / MMB-1) TaxID=717774 RepID=F2K2J2_MARM1|nr:OadG family transporter subunit [Marinomonas mediterranea]ADZ90037.1 sodium pump decarboxylase, gamma subunit [Marinomonas mediterranea MMB-1]WCN08102.1 oxaloacetate decarboxylase [Marinomonas mediterranea]WCN12172.1 oxaloacetate decarboxylase [Marinomonas mediterranea]WCN16244.1 oxaloacetate decarboxylase [Marinomonas mediterranea MMB-1]
MNELVSEGIGLMVLGMGFVFLFLIVLIFATSYMSTLVNKLFPEVAQPATPAKAPSASAAANTVDPQIIAAISAAIHQHRNR